MGSQVNVLAPGARVEIRNAEWLVKRVDRTTTGSKAIRVVGMSELVRNIEAVFLKEKETSLKVLDPEDTQLVADDTSCFRASLLYMESLLRQVPPTDEGIHIGHLGAMDQVDYQLDPARHSLKQPRQRILIADAVGLGKTLEAGVLLSELIRRGKGKRILVVAVKSMLTQFQKEMWSRFTIPLMRLDSVGIQRIRTRIPTNHNPFHYYDKAIISIDTLKQDAEYRTYLEHAYWDIIVIDEAHNVAQRGSSSSLRNRLANLLSRRSDTLIMLSATPHDGKARSFASLMNMLDPTAIADPDDYGKEDIKGLFMRRFKKDIQEQVETAFKKRSIYKKYATATPQEEEAFRFLADMEFSRIDQRRGGSHLFKTTLEKALFSSPAACIKTIDNRVRRLQKSDDTSFEKDIEKLLILRDKVESIGVKSFSKFQELIKTIQLPTKGMGWSPRNSNDRLVIFTERIETLKFLREHLPTELGLKDKQVEILHGGMSDIDQQRIVEEFGKNESPVRLLIASDVASEGINLHFLCHRMIHFDIPWSLMVFAQRNGRIDRYGQEHAPQIYYLITDSNVGKIRGDQHILELLIEKDQQAQENIGDPSVFMGVYDSQKEEDITAQAIEESQSPEDFEAKLEKIKETTFDPLSLLLGEDDENDAVEVVEVKKMPSVFTDDYTYLKTALEFLQKGQTIQVEFFEDKGEIRLTAPPELQDRFKNLPKEVCPQDDVFFLSDRIDTIKKEITDSRKEETAWPRIHYLWPLNPVVEWINDKVTASFRRHQAPVLTLSEALNPGEVIFIISGLIPNKKGHPLFQWWLGVGFDDGKFKAIEDFESMQNRIGLGRKDFPNSNKDVDTESLKKMLPEAINHAKEWITQKRKELQSSIDDRLVEYLVKLEELKTKHRVKVEYTLNMSKAHTTIKQDKKQREFRRIDKLFKDYEVWIEDTMQTEDNPYIQIIAVLRGDK